MARLPASCRAIAARHRALYAVASIACCLAMGARGTPAADALPEATRGRTAGHVPGHSAPNASGNVTGNWAGAELAQRGDPRPTADVPEPVPAASRRTGRRIRRTTRRVRGTVPATEAGPSRVPTAEAGSTAEPGPTAATAAPVPQPGPTATGPAVTHRGQPYGAAGHARQRFDLHLPAGCAADGVPLVVWIRGTDWRGSPQDDCPLLWLVREGYAVASIDHRPSDVAVFPAQLEDCRAAVETLCRDADLWGIDPERVCVFGRAAGGHLAALVAFTSPGAPADDADRTTETAAGIAALGTIGAPFHLASLGGIHQRGTSPASRLVGGPLAEVREAARRASPLEQIPADAPPTLLLHAARDQQVPAEQSAALDRALRAAGADSTLVMLDDDGNACGPGSASGHAIRGFLDRIVGPGRPAAADRPRPR